MSASASEMSASTERHQDDLSQMGEDSKNEIGVEILQMQEIGIDIRQMVGDSKQENGNEVEIKNEVQWARVFKMQAKIW